jgi:phosphatidylglycerophosphatase C
VIMALFDFDGTITSKDSLFDFVAYAFGRRRFLVGCVLMSPIFLAYALRIISGQATKEWLLRYYLKDLEFEAFKITARRYAQARLPSIIRKNALKRIYWHKTRGHKVVVVSASIDCWVKDWCLQNGLDLIATRLEVKNHRLTGNIYSLNCTGAEKVRRIEERFNLEEFDYIYAYGDSRGDKEMLGLADEKFYKWKRI